MSMAPPLAALAEPRATAISGVYILQSNGFCDHRGRFARAFDRDLLAPVFGARTICQVNLSQTRARGALRGLHYQVPPHAEAKLVRCLRGAVLDVAVDLRAGSPTFLQHVAVELRPEHANALFIPEGCAHGFQLLEPDSELLYIHTAPYVPGSEGGLRFDDPRLAIPWPLPPADLSDRDRNHPLLASDYEGIVL
jgi:dTDP-4-dehydrorhamnose 3,5-epimerase